MLLADDDVLLPGLVDTHVHVNEPGPHRVGGLRARATRAAAAGGVTTLVDMPLNCIPPTVDVARAGGQADGRATGSATSTSASGAARCPATSATCGRCTTPACSASSASWSHSGVEEFPPLDRGRAASRLRRGRVARRAAARARRGPARARRRAAPAGRLRRLPRLAAARGRERARSSASSTLRRRDRRAGAHRCTCPAASALPLIAAARGATGVRVTAETCPHYLTLTAEEIPDGATEFKCCPPIREARQPRALWAGLADGTIDLRRLRPLALHRRPQGGAGDFAHGLGRHRLAPARPAARCGPRPGSAGTRSPTWCAGWPPAPAALVGPARARAAIAVGARRRPRRARAGRDVHRRPGRAAPPQPGHAVRRPDPRPASCGRPGCAAADRRPDGDRPRGRLLDRRRRPHDATFTADPTARPRLARRSAASVVCANDEFFAERENLIKPDAGLRARTTFGPQGQGVRRLGDPAPARAPGHDWPSSGSACPGVVARRRGRHRLFTGNYPPYASVEAASVAGLPVAGGAARDVGRPLVPRSRRSKGDAAQRVRGRRGTGASPTCG